MRLRNFADFTFVLIILGCFVPRPRVCRVGKHLFLSWLCGYCMSHSSINPQTQTVSSHTSVQSLWNNISSNTWTVLHACTPRTFRPYLCTAHFQIDPCQHFQGQEMEPMRPLYESHMEIWVLYGWGPCGGMLRQGPIVVHGALSCIKKKKLYKYKNI